MKKLVLLSNAENVLIESNLPHFYKRRFKPFFFRDI